MYYGFRNILSNTLIVWIIPIILLLLIGTSIYMIGKNKKQNNQYRSDSALEILNIRFAKGEIDEEEYSENKRSLNMVH